MSRALTWMTGIFLAAAVVGGGCVTETPVDDRSAKLDVAGMSSNKPKPEQAGATASPVSVVHQASFSQCSPATGEARLILFDASSWAAHLTSVGSDASELADWQPDFATQTVVMIALGQKSTLGHSIALSGQAQRSADALELAVTIGAPAPGMMAAMALSRPCVYAVLASAPVSRVNVKDSGNGDLLQRWTR